MCTRPRARNWSRWKDERHDIADLRNPQRRAGRRTDAGIARLRGQDRAAAAAANDNDPWPEVTWPLAADPALEKRITDLMAGMTVEDKVGQLVQG